MFDWDDEKDAWLRSERGLGFDDILFHIEAGDLVLTADHPDQEKYPGQKIMYVRIENFVWMVPFVDGRIKFLKTIIPSRKATRDLLGE